MLEIKKVTKKYGQKTAIKDISLVVNEGEIFGFVGPNGAGKTTLIKSVVGIHEFDQGDILIEGISIKQNEITYKKKLAYIPDNPDLYENLKGIDYLNFIADIYEVEEKEREKLIKEYSELFGIYKNLGDLISSYSHGMKQKLAIISALIHNPKVLILDEPFVGLDPKAVYDMKEIMREMVKNGKTIFFSTHILDVAEKLCDRVAIIKNGSIVKVGNMKDIKGDESLEQVFLELGEE